MLVLGIGVLVFKKTGGGVKSAGSRVEPARRYWIAAA